MARLADAVLDRSVIGGYSRLGFALRARGWGARGWDSDDPAAGSLVDRTVAVTGGTSGIGAAIAGRVAALGGHPILIGRHRDKADAVRADIIRTHPSATVGVELGDVSDLDQVRRLATRLAAAGVDVLVHNAGVMPPKRTESAQGHELSLATHVLGPILLTELLEPTLAASADARVIFMSSGGMYTSGLPVDDLEYRADYRGARAYARSKRVQTALVPILAERWGAAGMLVAGMHPGWVDTPGVADSLPGFKKVASPLLRTAEQGADTAVWLAATQPRPDTGLFWHDRRPRPENYLPTTRFTEHDRRLAWDRIREAAQLDDIDNEAGGNATGSDR